MAKQQSKAPASAKTARASATPQRARAPKTAANPSGVQAVAVSVQAQQAAFLTAFGQIGVVTAAAKMVGIDRKRHYEWLADPRFPDYPAQFVEAEAIAVDRMEQAVITRGVHGWDEPVYQGGKRVGVRRMFSDRLLELAVKARMPQYREHSRVEQTGANGGPIAHVHAHLDVSQLTTAELERLMDNSRRLLDGEVVDGQRIEAEPAPTPEEQYRQVLERRNGNGEAK